MIGLWEQGKVGERVTGEVATSPPHRTKTPASQTGGVVRLSTAVRLFAYSCGAGLQPCWATAVDAYSCVVLPTAIAYSCVEAHASHLPHTRYTPALRRCASFTPGARYLLYTCSLHMVYTCFARSNRASFTPAMRHL